MLQRLRITGVFALGLIMALVCLPEAFAATATQTMTVIINNVNRAPALAVIGNKTIAEGQLLEFTVTATDPDGENLTLSASNLPAGANFNPATGVFSWTPGYNSAGVYNNVHFEATDGDLKDIEDINITVTDINRVPVIQEMINVTANEGETVIVQPLASDADGDVLTYSVSGLPDGAVYTFDTATGKLEWQVNYKEAGSYTLTFTADDKK